MNLVLDEVEEVMRGMCLRGLSHITCIDRTYTDDEGNTSTRALGLLVARGTLLVTLAPADGSEEISNPFLEDEEEVKLG